jgi:hypothetical protein
MRNASCPSAFVLPVRLCFVNLGVVQGGNLCGLVLCSYYKGRCSESLGEEWMISTWGLAGPHGFLTAPAIVGPVYSASIDMRFPLSEVLA